MKRVLVTYATLSGTTVEVARAVAEEIGRQGIEVDVRPINEVTNLARYDGVVVGGPMVMGWHRAAQSFLRRNRAILQQKPLAVFVTAMSLMESSQTQIDGVPVVVDPNLPKAPQQPGRLTFRERYAQLSNYLRPILSASRPASIGVFGGCLEYGRLKWWAVLFAMVIIQAPAGDRRNWDAIRTWAAGVPAAFQFEEPVRQAVP